MHDRPLAVKAVFLLTVFKIILAGGFFAFFSLRGGAPIDPSIILYTAAAYALLALPTFVFIHRHNATAVRVCLGLAIVASLPARAGVGILIDIVCLVLTLRPSAKRFFAAGRIGGAL